MKAADGSSIEDTPSGLFSARSACYTSCTQLNRMTTMLVVKHELEPIEWDIYKRIKPRALS